ncbi:hypothetical protein BKA62DRAFT_690739 [Auriculariales sp. MPI-PUGE-AT-0066]|nr:hypothetical protein BKA62DRAFT_690739 [Auriculariales sp. MPI-PUGE-AT-0066]
MQLFALAALALVAAVARAGRSTVEFLGNDEHWRAVPSTVDIAKTPLTGPECIHGGIASVLKSDQRIELMFTGSQLTLFGVPPSGDVKVRYELDADERPPPALPHAGPPGPDQCIILRSFNDLEDRLHNLTIFFDRSPDGSALPNPDTVHLLIANATVITSQQLPGQTEIKVASSGEQTSDSGSTTISSTASPLPASAESASAGSAISTPAQPAKHNFIIAAAAIGGLVVFFVVGFAIYWLVRRRQRRIPPSAAFRARMARTDFVMVTGGTSATTSRGPDVPPV